jgi:hypothetical protein
VNHYIERTLDKVHSVHSSRIVKLLLVSIAKLSNRMNEILYKIRINVFITFITFIPNFHSLSMFNVYQLNRMVRMMHYQQ